MKPISFIFKLIYQFKAKISESRTQRVLLSCVVLGGAGFLIFGYQNCSGGFGSGSSSSGSDSASVMSAEISANSEALARVIPTASPDFVQALAQVTTAPDGSNFVLTAEKSYANAAVRPQGTPLVVDASAQQTDVQVANAPVTVITPVVNSLVLVASSKADVAPVMATAKNALNLSERDSVNLILKSDLSSNSPTLTCMNRYKGLASIGTLKLNTGAPISCGTVVLHCPQGNCNMSAPLVLSNTRNLFILNYGSSPIPSITFNNVPGLVYIQDSNIQSLNFAAGVGSNSVITVNSQNIVSNVGSLVIASASNSVAGGTAPKLYIKGKTDVNNLNIPQTGVLVTNIDNSVILVNTNCVTPRCAPGVAPSIPTYASQNGNPSAPITCLTSESCPFAATSTPCKFGLGTGVTVAGSACQMTSCPAGYSPVGNGCVGSCSDPTHFAATSYDGGLTCIKSESSLCEPGYELWGSQCVPQCGVIPHGYTYRGRGGSCTILSCDSGYTVRTYNNGIPGTDAQVCSPYVPCSITNGIPKTGGSINGGDCSGSWCILGFGHPSNGDTRLCLPSIDGICGTGITASSTVGSCLQGEGTSVVGAWPFLIWQCAGINSGKTAYCSNR